MDKTALITGTTSGIGKAFCEKFASKGFNLILVSRNPEKLLLQKGALAKKYKIHIYTIAANLEETGAAQKVYEEIRRSNFRVDILINNAGFNEYGSFLKTDTAKELSMIQLHICFTTEFTKLILSDMLKNKSGKIVNIGSTGSFIPCPLDAVYAATKSYILSFSKALRGELVGTGITVSVVCPGSTATEFAGKAKMENTVLFQKFVMKPEKVVDLAYSKMQNGKMVIIPGIYNKLLVLSAKILPSGLINRVTCKMLQ